MPKAKWAICEASAKSLLLSIFRKIFHTAQAVQTLLLDNKTNNLQGVACYHQLKPVNDFHHWTAMTAAVTVVCFLDLSTESRRMQ